MPPFLLLAFLMQPPDLATVFPTDTRTLSQASDADLIQTVCPGHVEKGGKVECGKNCPSSTGLDGGQHLFDWTLMGVTQGHFLSATSDDAVIATAGCESHSENFGGSILLTRRSGKWKNLWYRSGIITANCHKVQIDIGRDILACMADYGAQSFHPIQLYVEDLARPQPCLMGGGKPVLEIIDDTDPCGDEVPAGGSLRKHGVVEKVEFGQPVMGKSTMSVHFSVGKLALSPGQRSACEKFQNLKNPLMLAYRLDFILNGNKYYPTSSSAVLMKRLGL